MLCCTLHCGQHTSPETMHNIYMYRKRDMKFMYQVPSGAILSWGGFSFLVWGGGGGGEGKGVEKTQSN